MIIFDKWIKKSSNVSLWLNINEAGNTNAGRYFPPHLVTFFWKYVREWSLKDFFFHSCSLLNSEICHSELFSVLESSNLVWPMCYQAQVTDSCAIISVELALVKVQAAALPSAKISNWTCWGRGWKNQEDLLEGRNWERCLVVSAWRNKVQETMYSLVLALWKTRLVKCYWWIWNVPDFFSKF